MDDNTELPQYSLYKKIIAFVLIGFLVSIPFYELLNPIPYGTGMNCTHPIMLLYQN
jgi:hypothetical protein